MIQNWRDWLPAALTVVGLCIGLAASVQDLRIQRLAHSDAAAFVNGQPISQDDVERALAALGSDRRAQLTRQDRDAVLERMIEDELLAQRAISLGLPATDPSARKVLVRALIDSLVAAAAAPTEDELRAYFEANSELFRSADMIAVAVEGGGAAGLPSTPMTVDKLKDYLGEGAEKLRTVPAGGTAGPFQFAGRPLTLRVVSRSGGTPGAFEQSRDAVMARFVVERDGRRLRSYIEGLKRSAKIERLQ